MVRFISYVPSAATDVCQPSFGSSYFYAVNLLDGTAFEDLNEDVVIPRRKDVRKQAIATPGIAPPVSTIFVKTGSNITPIDVSGANKLHDWGDVAEPKRWFWAETPDF